MEKHFAVFSGDAPELGDFVYNAKAGTVDRVVEFNTAVELTSRKQCTVDAARDYGHQVIDIEKLTEPGVVKTLKKLETMAEYANHTDYSDYIILKALSAMGRDDNLVDAYRVVSKELGLRVQQVSSRHQKLRLDGTTIEDVENYTQDDVDNFYPGGDKSPKQRSSPLQYNEERTDWKGQERANYLRPSEEEMIKKTDQSHIIPNQMKTILVVYTHSCTPLSEKQIRSNKLYAFNTPSELKVGDTVNSEAYSTPMRVVKVLDKSAKYYNRSTGELSDEFTSTEQRELATLVIREDSANTVYGSIEKCD